jgi:predicted membrane GTPase involved in stress response
MNKKMVKQQERQMKLEHSLKFLQQLHEVEVHPELLESRKPALRYLVQMQELVVRARLKSLGRGLLTENDTSLV